MMSPEMMKAAQEMMAKMSPEQLEEVRRQAANMDPAQMQAAMDMAKHTTPEQLKEMEKMYGNVPGGIPGAPPATRPPPSTSPASNMSAQQKYQYDASTALKAEGNKLYGAGQYKAAAEKYQRGISNLTGHAFTEAVALRTTCQSNLASCYLQLEQWTDCVSQCDAVLQADPRNRKALYRRGQARTALGKHAAAVRDLEKALELSPESEKAVIKEKLDLARQQQDTTTVYKQGGVIIEEVNETASMPPAAAAAEDDVGKAKDVAQTKDIAQAKVAKDSEAEGVNVDDEDDTEVEVLPPPASPSTFPPPVPHVAAAMEEMSKNPGGVKKAMDAFSSMSSEEIAANLAMNGQAMPPGFSPEMAKAAAAMMKSMPDDQLQAMAKQAASMAGSGAMPAMPPVPPAMPAGGTSSTGAPLDPQAAAAAFMRNPDNMKNAMKMMENMSDEDFERMTASVPGAPPGMKMDAKQMKMAAKMMENMKPEDMEHMAKLAQTMGGVPPGPGGAAGGGGPPAMPDPSTLLQNMSDPTTLRAMQNMLKSVDDDTLVDAMRASGINIDVDQAKKMIDGMGSVSDKQLAIIAWFISVLQKIYVAYKAVKTWATGNGALFVAILVLLLALYLRWKGYV